jgi:hypothetical protein
VATLSAADANAQTTKQGRLAYWINGYNALTVQGILDVYPTKRRKERRKGCTLGGRPALGHSWGHSEKSEPGYTVYSGAEERYKRKKKRKKVSRAKKSVRNRFVIRRGRFDNSW